jgi:diguanylate cyclase (GGDEF)-like protein
LLFPAAVSPDNLITSLAFVVVTTVIMNWMLIRERRRRDAVENELRNLAIYDPLTGLLIRAYFIAILEKAVARAKRGQTKLGVIFIDLDDFKTVNDSFGHYTGDLLLHEVAKRLEGIIRSADSAARYGGDEFVLLVDGDKGGGTERLACRVVEALSRPIDIQGVTIVITASVGYAVFPDHGDGAETLLHAADKAMYGVKALGKNATREAVPFVLS